MLEKLCKCCNIVKPFSAFCKNSTKKYGLDSQCKVCKARGDKKYRKENAHKLREYFQEYHLLNKELKVRRACEWQKQNSGKANANKKLNELKRAKRFPAWLTKEQLDEIAAIYKLAANKSKSEGIEYHVDHIIPLNGKLVSGLHIPSNLQIITKEENLTKQNKFVI